MSVLTAFSGIDGALLLSGGQGYSRTLNISSNWSEIRIGFCVSVNTANTPAFVPDSGFFGTPIPAPFIPVTGAPLLFGVSDSSAISSASMFFGLGAGNTTGSFLTATSTSSTLVSGFQLLHINSLHNSRATAGAVTLSSVKWNVAPAVNEPINFIGLRLMRLNNGNTSGTAMTAGSTVRNTGSITYSAVGISRTQIENLLDTSFYGAFSPLDDGRTSAISCAMVYWPFSASQLRIHAMAVKQYS